MPDGSSDWWIAHASPVVRCRHGVPASLAKANPTAPLDRSNGSATQHSPKQLAQSGSKVPTPSLDTASSDTAASAGPRRPAAKIDLDSCGPEHFGGCSPSVAVRARNHKGVVRLLSTRLRFAVVLSTAVATAGLMAPVQAIASAPSDDDTPTLLTPKGEHEDGSE